MPHYYQTSARKENSEHHVFIAIPCYGDIKAGCVDSLNKVQHDLLANRISLDVAILAGSCHVDDARNDLCRMFLESECTHLMFIDADLTFSPNSVRTLLGHDVDVVGGVYQFKNDEIGFPVNMKEYGYNERGLVPVEGLPGGFMLIKRKVIERLYKKAADKGAWPNKGDYGVMPVTEIFHRTVEKGRSRRSGDYEFSRKVTKSGFGLFMDATLNFGHIGDKIWQGENVGVHHLRKLGIVDKIARDVIHNLTGEPDEFAKVCKAYGNEPWAIDPVLLGVLWFQMKGLGEGATFFETGTGVSTAMFCAEGWKGISLEHSKMWRGYLEDFMDRVEIKENSICMSALEDDGWYGYRQHDYQPDLVFIDGPVRKVGGERAGIIKHCRNMVRNAKALVVDDTDDGDGLKLLGSLEELGWKFQVVNGPRRKFAIGEKSE